MIRFVKELRLFEAFPSTLVLTHEPERGNFVWRNLTTGDYGYAQRSHASIEWYEIGPQNVKGARMFPPGQVDDFDGDSSAFVEDMLTAPPAPVAAPPPPVPAPTLSAVPSVPGIDGKGLTTEQISALAGARAKSPKWNSKPIT